MSRPNPIKEWYKCGRKTPLTSRACTEIIIKAYMRKGIKLYKYNCNYCGKWHLSRKYGKDSAPQMRWDKLDKKKNDKIQNIKK